MDEKKEKEEKKDVRRKEGRGKEKDVGVDKRTKEQEQNDGS